MKTIRTVRLTVTDESIMEDLFQAILSRLLQQKGEIRYDRLTTKNPGKDIYWVYGLCETHEDYFLSIIVGPAGELGFLDHYLMEERAPGQTVGTSFTGIPMEPEEVEHWCSCLADVIMEESFRLSPVRAPSMATQ